MYISKLLWPTYKRHVLPSSRSEEKFLLGNVLLFQNTASIKPK